MEMKLNEIKIFSLLLFSKLLFLIMQKKLDLTKTLEGKIFSLINHFSFSLLNNYLNLFRKNIVFFIVHVFLLSNIQYFKVH